MDEKQLTEGKRESFGGAEVRDGKIFAANMLAHVEESYLVAYNLGCGNKKWKNWINVDLHSDIADIQCNLKNLHVIESDSADAVAAIHVLEHFYKWEVHDLLTEWKRILKPKGKMILELPCMEKVFVYITNCVAKGDPMMEFMTTHALFGDPKYKEPAMCHRWGWFQQELVKVLEEVGMREITVCKPRYHFPFRDMRIECVK